MDNNPIILHLETGTKTCSVALSKGPEIIQVVESELDFQHANSLLPFVKNVLKKSKLEMNQINAVSVGTGPGSYTGLRIGLSMAKGLCFGLDIPLYGISSLQALASGAQETTPQINYDFYISMIDARRNEAYTAMYNQNLELVLEPTPSIIDEAFVQAFSAYDNVCYCGNAVHKLFPFFGENQANLLTLKSSAKHLVKLGLTQWKLNTSGDLNSVKESYLKLPLITQSKKAR